LSCGVCPQRRSSSRSTWAVRSCQSRDVGGVGRGRHLQARGTDQIVQLAAGREVVALRRVVQLPGNGQVDQQADPPGRADDPAQLPQHGELGLRAGRGTQHAQAPGHAGRLVRKRQRGAVGLDDGQVKERGRGTARARLRFGQDQPGAGALARVGGRAAHARPHIEHQLTRLGRQPGQQPVQRRGLPAAPAGGRDEELRAQVGGHPRGPFRHGAELGGHRIIDVVGHPRLLPG
jgi:hypothetical protein